MHQPTPAPTDVATVPARPRNAVLDRVAARIQQRLASEMATAKPYGDAAHAASLIPEQ